MSCGIFANVKIPTTSDMLELRHERDRDFMKRCREIMARPGEVVNLRAVAREAELTGCRSYYVSHNYALRKIREMRRRPGRVEHGRRAELWRELDAKVRRLMESRGLAEADALTAVLADGRASRFFMAPETAWRLLRDEMARCRRRRGIDMRSQEFEN